MTLWPDQIAYPPRGLSRDEAARYVGVSNTTFDRMVQFGWMPRPKRVFTRLIWDRLQLDAAFTDLSEQQANPLDRMLAAEEAWERKYDARKGQRTSADAQAAALSKLADLPRAALDQARAELRTKRKEAARAKARPPRSKP
jgi:predicted DNA-binding transcriptional regulator AlpA